MPWDSFIGLIVFAFVTSVTPGPNNMMLFASGVNFGFRRSVPHMLGISSGFFTLLIGVGLGIGALLKSMPILDLALKVASGGYMLWIAWKIGSTHTLADVKARARPMTFLEAAAFQWINPKAWAMAIPAMAAYADQTAVVSSVFFISAVFAIINLPSTSCWAAFGSSLREWLSVPPRLKYFNITMAILLVLSLWPMLK